MAVLIPIKSHSSLRSLCFCVNFCVAGLGAELVLAALMGSALSARFHPFAGSQRRFWQIVLLLLQASERCKGEGGTGWLWGQGGARAVGCSSRDLGSRFAFLFFPHKLVVLYGNGNLKRISTVVSHWVESSSEKCSELPKWVFSVCIRLFSEVLCFNWCILKRKLGKEAALLKDHLVMC